MKMKKLKSYLGFNFRPLFFAGLLFIFTITLPSTAGAVGTPAGTLIENQASVSYIVDAATYSADSPLILLPVDEVLGSTLTWQDAANVAVLSPDTDKVLTYLLTNIGNGTETFELNADNAVGGDTFDPTTTRIYLDTDGDGVFSVGDTLYVLGTNDPVLAPDASIAIFIVNNIPSGLLAGDLGSVSLSRTSTTGSGVVGTNLLGAGDGGVDAIIGASGGSLTTTATYVIAAVIITATKTQTILDPFGGVLTMPGSVITYTIIVTASGTGTATGVVFTDPIPANTTYNLNTLSLNSTPLSDAGGDDQGDVNATTPGVITVTLGDMTSLSPTQTITFEVTIN